MTQPASDSPFTAIVEILIPILRTGDPDDRARAIELLSVLGRFASLAVPELISLLQDEGQSTLWPGIARILEKVGPPDAEPAVPTLLERIKELDRLDDPSPLVDALGAIQSPLAIPALIKLLETPGPLFSSACYALAEFGPSAACAVATLQQAFGDARFSGSRASIAQAVSCIGPASPENIAILHEVFLASRGAARAEAVMQLYHIMATGPVIPNSLIDLHVDLMRTEPDKVAMWSALALGLARNASAVPALAEVAKSSREVELRSEAIRALGFIGEVSPAHLSLVEGLLADADGRIRAMAAFACSWFRKAATRLLPKLRELNMAGRLEPAQVPFSLIESRILGASV